MADATRGLDPVGMFAAAWVVEASRRVTKTDQARAVGRDTIDGPGATGFARR